MFAILKLVFVLLFFFQISEIKGNHRSVRVINGESGLNKNYTYMVAIYVDGTMKCGGVNLNGGVVLTAAHCIYQVDQTKLSVKTGSDTLTDKSMQNFAIDSVMIHENYSDTTRENDLAIIKLSSKMFGPSISPISYSKDRNIFVLETCTVIGWGLVAPYVESDFLRDGEVTVMENSECLDALKKVAADQYFQETQKYCAEGINDEVYYTDACQRDGGGPLVCNNTVIGIVSWAQCNQPNNNPPSIFVDVGYYADWIVAHGGASATTPTALFASILLVIYKFWNN